MKFPKFNAGDAVHIQYTTDDEHVVSADVFVIIEVNEILTQRGTEYVYNLETPDGRIIKGFLESKLAYTRDVNFKAPKETEVKVVAPKKPTGFSKDYSSDELLDEYNYQMRMYELTHFEEIKEAADMLREEWERLYGKDKQTGAV